MSLLWRCLLGASSALFICLFTSVKPGLAQDATGTGASDGAPRVAAVMDLSAPVLIHPATQVFPAIDGRNVVWQDERSGPADIFFADLDTGSIRNLTDSSQWEADPDISGSYVVWRDGYAGIGIHGMDITTGALFTVTVGHTDISRPSISGTVVVWADKRAGGGDWNIYGYDIKNRQEFVIDAAPVRQQSPKIDGDYVVWWDYRERIFLYSVAEALQWKAVSIS